MFKLVIGTVIYVCFSAIMKAQEAEMERKWKEAEETDWNEYYANI